MVSYDWDNILQKELSASIAFDMIWDMFCHQFNQNFPIKVKVQKPKGQKKPCLNDEILERRKEFLELLSIRHVRGNDPNLKTALKVNKQKY